MIGRNLLISAGLLPHLRPGADVTVESLGLVSLRGRAAPPEVFAVGRAAAAHVS